jgi:WhiB family transcriptional regulator, redox-sensing transcriptional regulator
LPFYNQINWKKAECSESYTELFYTVEEERNIKAYNYINAVRSICARCPIFRDCLAYGFAHEEYGVWGGMTTAERKSISAPEKYPKQLRRAIYDLAEYGITYTQIKEAYEYSRNDRSVENKSGNNRKDGSASNSRPR